MLRRMVVHLREQSGMGVKPQSTNRVISYNLAYECKPPKKRSTPIKQKVTVIRLNAAHQANFLPLFGFDEKVSLVLKCRYAA